MKCSESLSNRVSNVSRRYEYIGNMKFAAYMAFLFTIFHYVLMFLSFVTVCMVVCFVHFCLIL